MFDSYVIVDIETTGLSPQRDAITQIAAQRYIDGIAYGDFFNVYVNSGAEIPEKITELTGIDNMLLKRYGVPLTEAMSSFRQYIGDCRLIAHNGKRFNFLFLDEASIQSNISIWNEREDSLPLAKRLVPGLRSYSLASLVKYFGIRERKAHRAQNDVLMLADVVERLYALQRHSIEMFQMAF